MLRKHYAIIAVGLGVAVITGGAAFAAAQVASEPAVTITACVNNATGAVRIPAAGAVCDPASEHAVTWNQAGLPGPAGTPGAPGAPGPAGTPGAAGIVPCPREPVGAPTGGRGLQAFLDVNGIPGESQNAKHLGQIDLQTWSWSAGDLGVLGCGPRTNASGNNNNNKGVQDLTVKKSIDKSSPKLFLAAVAGTNVPSVTLNVTKFIGSTAETDYLVVTFEQVLVSSIQPSSGGDSPTESVSFNFSKVTVSERPQKADNSFGPPVVTCFDFAANKAC